MLLTESHLSNQHIEIVHMFLNSEFLTTELAVLAYFTHKITLPFLYFVEVSSQAQLLQMFPQLFNDLKEGRMDILKDYVINYPHVKVQKPTADIEEKILQKMCIDATEVLNRKLVGSTASAVTKRNLHVQASCMCSPKIILLTYQQII